MITVLKITGVLAVLVIMTSFMPVVEELPFGMDAALTLFAGTVRAIIELLPFLQIVFTLILLAMVIKIALFSWVWIKWFIEIVRG